MKLLQKLLAATSIFAATAAIAGPPVTVTFKNNNTTTDATYRIVTTNESSTYANASPKPATTVSKLGSNSYAVTSSFFAHNRARYAGSKYEEGLL